MSLKDVYLIIENINNHSGRLDKEKIIFNEITNNKLLIKVIEYAYNPFKMYNLTTIDFISNLDDKHDIKLIFQFLDYLSSKNGATNEDRQQLSILASIDKETFEIVSRIINKDLRCGVGVKTFKKFIPSIPTYDVMLCEKDLEYYYYKVIKEDLSKSCWSEKLDGVRCTASYLFNDKFKYLSRNGKPFENFSIFDNELTILYNRLITKYKLESLQYDGEVTAVTTNKKDKKTFQKLMTQIKRLKDIDSNLFRFNIFDVIIPGIIYSQRYWMLKETIEELQNEGIEFKVINLLEHFSCSMFKNEKDILEFTENKIESEGWEGIILQTVDGLYEFKRTRNLCKVKKFHTVDCKVIKAEYGTGRNSHRLGKLIAIHPEYKTEFGVGSGFTDIERELFINNPPNMIEVKYQELTDTNIPRFPVFVRVRDDK